MSWVVVTASGLLGVTIILAAVFLFQYLPSAISEKRIVPKSFVQEPVEPAVENHIDILKGYSEEPKKEKKSTKSIRKNDRHRGSVATNSLERSTEPWGPYDDLVDRQTAEIVPRASKEIVSRTSDATNRNHSQDQKRLVPSNRRKRVTSRLSTL